MRIHFAILGPLLVEADGVPQPVPRSPVLRSLLGIMLLAEGRHLPVSRMLELIWTDQADCISRGAVHTGVSRLRDWLSRLGDDTVALGFDGGGYRLAVRRDAVDLGRFRDLVAAGDPAAAIALRRGPVLADATRLDRRDPLLCAVQADLRSAALAWADAAAAEGTAREALAHLTALAEQDPLDELVQARRMRLLTADGRPAEALRLFQTLRVQLGEELGVEPCEETQQAFLAVLARESEPEARGTPADPAQLPPCLPDFTGRREQEQAVLEALVQRKMPLIAGMAGIGKTALAVHAAYQARAEFPDGQLYVDLRGADREPTDPAQVIAAFLHALGVDSRQIPESLEQRSALYRSVLAGRRILVVLDNAGSEQQVRPLLPGVTASRSAQAAAAPGPAAMVTSRAALTALEGVMLVDLDVMRTEQATALLRRIVGEERVDAEPAAAEEIAELCGGVPLAVRIAGGRLAGRPHWRLARLANLLRDERGRLDELTTGDLAVRASFALSYARLAPDTRRVFRSLGWLDAPDFASWVAAAAADIAPKEAERHVETLVDVRLLNTVGAGPRLRYRLHDLVRLYARELAETDGGAAGGAAAVGRALGGWLWLAERAADRIPGPSYAAIHGPARRWEVPQSIAAGILDDPLAWFDDEQPALAAAVRQALSLGAVEAAWDLAACQEKYWDIRGLHDECHATNAMVLRACRSVGDERGAAVMTRGLVEVSATTAPDEDVRSLAALHDRAQELQRGFRAAGEPRGEADALVIVAWSQLARGQLHEAGQTARQVLELANSTGHTGAQARACQILAIACSEDDVGGTFELLARSLDLARSLGNARSEASALQFLGAAHVKAGRAGLGHDLLSRSLVMARAFRDRQTEAFALLYLAEFYSADGDARARQTAETALRRSTTLGMGHQRAHALRVLGDVEAAAGEHAAAIAHLEESVRLWRSRGWTSFLREALRSLARAYSAAGDEQAAAAARNEAAEMARRPADGGRPRFPDPVSDP